MDVLQSLRQMLAKILIDLLALADYYKGEFKSF
jgi:hypothetical protein